MTTTPFTTVTELRAQHELVTELQRAVRLDADRVTQLPHPLGERDRLTEGVLDTTTIAPVRVEAPLPERERTFDEVLEQRVSDRFYSDETVAPEALARIVRAAREFDRSTWTEDAQADLGLDFLVAARSVDGAAPAIYRLVDDTFMPLAPLPERGAEDLVLQIEFAYAPVILIALAPFANLLARWGDHGERLANTRAAAAISAALHEAASLGIAGSPFAGFLTSGLRRLIDADGYANAQMFAASFGHPAA
jgi:hypothetical protein